MFCTKCGTEIPEGTNICPKCHYAVPLQEGQEVENAVPWIVKPEPTTAPKTNSSLAIVSLVFGIICAVMPGVLVLILWPLALAAVITGLIDIVGNKPEHKHGMSWAGVILAVLSVANIYYKIYSIF